MRKFVLSSLCALLVLGCAGAASAENNGELLHIAFNEGSGNQVTDEVSGTQTEIAYVFTSSPFVEKQDPQWRDQGVDGGCLLFDGCSNYAAFDPEQCLVQGDSFSISVWAAPRTFEWDDPNGADAGNEHLTALVGQYDKENKLGFLLGYQRFGRLCFQVGTGEDWVTLWGEKNLSKYEWNHVTAEFDGAKGQVSLFLNEEPVGTVSVPAGSSIAPADKEKLLVGKNAHADTIAAGTYNMFSGYMDELVLSEGPLMELQTEISDVPEIPYEEIALQNVLTGDPYKTQYHGGPYQHWMNEPHAPVYYNGMYHLFFQQNMTGTYWRNISWGHLVSEDLVNWRPVKEAITPTENTVVPDGVWSGGAALDKNGVPLLFFTAGNDSFRKEGLISNQNIGVAYPANLNDPELIDWVVCDELAVEQKPGQGRPGEFRDSHIWKEDDIWYMLVCSGSTETDGGTALLYSTDTLELKEDGTVDMNWEYHGPVYELENPSITYGTSWELPILLPFTNEAGTITKYGFFISPAPASSADNKVYYFVGDFDKSTGKFTPDAAFDNKPALLDYGSNVFTGPSMFTDPVSGNIYCVSIMQDQRNGAEEGAADWAHCVGLTRRIWLNDEGTDLMLEPISALKELEKEPLLTMKDATVDEVNEALAGIQEDMLVLRLTVDLQDAEEFYLYVKTGGKREETAFEYIREDESIGCNTRNRGAAAKSGYVTGDFPMKDSVLEMEVYIDRSLVEAYFNKTKSISMRSYADPSATGIYLETEGDILVKEISVAPMGSIYE